MRRRRLSTVRRRPRDSLLRLLRVDLGILLILLLVGGGLYLHHNPIRLGADEAPTAYGEARAGSVEVDVLLLLPAADSARVAESHGALDFAANWINILAQEFGPWGSTGLAELAPASLEGVALLVVPRSVAREMTPGQVATVEQFVHGGGRLLLELPTTVWEPLVGVVGDASQMRPTRRITAFDGSVVRGDLRDDAIQAPLLTMLSPVQMADVAAVDGVEVLMEVDGLPALVRRPLGQGEVFVLYFELARAVGNIQQGLPAADWEMARPSVPLPDGLTRTSALVADSRLRRSRMPSADLLERQVLSVVTAGRPMPRVWAFPEARPAALVMTHSGYPDWQSGRFLWEWEQAAGLPSTLFAGASELPQLPESLGAGVALTLVPPTVDSSPTRPVGLLGFTPLERPLSLVEQVAALSRIDSDGLAMVRMADGLWDPDFGHTFRVLAGLGVDVDSSYGHAVQPTDIEGVDGYSFGTGFPFRPLDRNGLLFPLWEVPVVLHDGARLDEAWSLNVLERSGRAYHQAIVADWRAVTMTTLPRSEVVTTWRHLYELARQRDYWITDLETFVRFWELREQVNLRSEFRPGERRLTVWVQMPELPVAGGEILSPSIAFEARYEDRPVERVIRNGQDVPFVELGRSGDGVFHLYDLPAGTSRVEITYQGPILLEE